MNQLSKPNPIARISKECTIPISKTPIQPLISEVAKESSKPISETPIQHLISEFSSNLTVPIPETPVQHLISEVSSDFTVPIPETPVQETKFSGFSFKMKPASKLKLAIKVLSDSELNPQGIGRIDIDSKGCEITVCSADKNVVTGHLWLKATGLIDFDCREPVLGKMVHLSKILNNLGAVVGVDDTVSVRLLENSPDELSFNFGTEHPKEFSAKLLENSKEIKRFPKITYFSEAVILNNTLRMMVPYFVEGGKLRTVFVDMMDKRVSVGVTYDSGVWHWSHEDNKHCGTRGLEPGQRHVAWFRWKHTRALRMASYLAIGFLVCFVTDPANSIMLRFNLRELGDLVFIKKALSITPNANLDDQFILQPTL